MDSFILSGFCFSALHSFPFAPWEAFKISNQIINQVSKQYYFASADNIVQPYVSHLHYQPVVFQNWSQSKMCQSHLRKVEMIRVKIYKWSRA